MKSYSRRLDDGSMDIFCYLEKYRSAYLCRDIETINLMFAEQALIIAGRKTQIKTGKTDLPRYQHFDKQPGYEYLKLIKQQYLERQKRIFAPQEEIFLDFASFDIKSKNNTRNVYGLEMLQSYQSTTYADEGYLFLLVDNNEKDPLIHVRAWQPNEWDQDALVGLGNFRIYR